MKMLKKLLDALADVLPAKWRKTIYAVGAVIGLALAAVPLVKAALVDGWQWSDLDQIITGLAASGAFTMAVANTG